MALSTRIKNVINAGLNRLGLHLDTLTAHRRETMRIERLARAGYFDMPAFPIPPSFLSSRHEELIEELAKHASRFEDLVAAERNPVDYSFDNGFFSSPDAEILYCVIRRYEPRRIVEIGSGNSTKISRLAIEDAKLDSTLCCIDPSPRSEIGGLADRIHNVPAESVEVRSEYADLKENDVLFIDSSHQIRAGNDVTHLYLSVLPELAPGVLVQIHDIFLPFDYPRDWSLEWCSPYAEQYLVQAMLQFGSAWEVIWPGHYLQRTRADFSSLFPHMRGRDAQSLWLRVR